MPAGLLTTAHAHPSAMQMGTRSRLHLPSSFQIAPFFVQSSYEFQTAVCLAGRCHRLKALGLR